MSPEKRSALMSRIKGKNTLPERLVSAALHEAGLECEQHAGDLPGRPDFVFRRAMVAVFVDGDFWHGWHFQAWRDKLTTEWELKIATTRARDQRNFRKLRRQGWVVIRLWEHQIHKNLPAATARILAALATRPTA
jgi:DNA mismatch endonuclease (patch repair protein)